MAVSIKQEPTKIMTENPQRRTGAILVGVGILLLAAGVLLLRSISVGTSSPLLKNISPLVPFAGLILLGQGVLVLRLKGWRLRAWFMVLPSVIFILVIVIFPTLYALGLSMVRWDVQVRDRSFVFLGNYAEVLTTDRVWGGLLHSAIIVLTAVPLEFILGIGLALLLYDTFPGRSLVTSLVIMPLMMAPVVVGQTWRMLWDTRFGAVNHALSLLVGRPVELLWLAQGHLAITAIVLTDVWRATPFVFLITLAGLLAIDREFYEAAAIDGASPWHIFWRITLPILRPVLLVGLLFRVIDNLQIVDMIFVLTRGGPGYDTETYPLYLYQTGFSYGRFGFTAAGAILFVIITVIITTVLIRRIGEL